MPSLLGKFYLYNLIYGVWPSLGRKIHNACRTPPENPPRMSTMKISETGSWKSLINSYTKG
jgi:hypothetical protein